jgi:hypothetical protein
MHFKSLDPQSIQNEVCAYFTLNQTEMKKRFSAMLPSSLKTSTLMEIDTPSTEPSQILKKDDYFLIPFAKEESAIALGAYIQSHFDDEEMKRSLETLQIAQDLDPEILAIIPSGLTAKIEDPLIRDFYARINARIATTHLQNPSVAYYELIGEIYHRQKSKPGSTPDWLAICVSANREKQCYNYDLLIPRII